MRGNNTTGFVLLWTVCCCGQFTGQCYCSLFHNRTYSLLRVMGCYVIVTTRNILWMILSVVATLSVLTGIMTPKWIVGFSRNCNRCSNRNTTNSLNQDLLYTPSIGIYNHCTRITTAVGAEPVDRCFEYINSFFDLPSNEWKACVVFLCLGTLLLSVVAIMSLVGFFMQSIGGKSIFSLGGVLQAFASEYIQYCISVNYLPTSELP